MVVIRPSRILSHLKYSNLIFFRYPNDQVTEKVWLVGEKSYYIKALMKEGGGGDHLSVGVRFPDGQFDRPISKNIFLLSGKSVKL